MISDVGNIKTGLALKGITQAKIARILGVTPVSVNDVISGKRKNPRIREVIALALNKPVSEIWPETAERKEENKKVPSPGCS